MNARPVYAARVTDFRVFVVCGNAGVGKTTFAQKWARQEGALLLDIDTASELLVRAGLAASGRDPDDRDSPEYKRVYRDAIHETLFAVARDNLATLPVVIVAPFTQERRRADFPEWLAERLGTPARVFFLCLPDAERRRRIERRGNPRDRAKLEAWSDYAESGRDVERPTYEHVWIDTSDPESSWPDE